MIVNGSPLTEGKYDYSKERKGVYVIFIYNTKILLPFTFDEPTDKKRYASTRDAPVRSDWVSSPDWVTAPTGTQSDWVSFTYKYLIS